MRILFVCVENAGRSQMAEGFARQLAPRGTEILSAGSRPAQVLNPAAISAMQERGIDIRGQKPKGFDAIAMGSSYQRGATWLGATTEYVIRNTPCRVLICKAATP